MFLIYCARDRLAVDGFDMGNALQPVDLRCSLGLRCAPEVSHSTFELVVLFLSAYVGGGTQNNPAYCDAEKDDANGDDAFDHEILPCVVSVSFFCLCCLYTPLVRVFFQISFL